MTGRKRADSPVCDTPRCRRHYCYQGVHGDGTGNYCSLCFNRLCDAGFPSPGDTL